MLSIRMQRTGRKGHAMFRVVVQDSRQAPTSGKVVAQLGHYDPHTKAVVIDKEQATTYLSNGAQPSDRVARLLKKEGVKLPSWVALSGETSKTTRNPEKLRKNQPKEEKVEEPVSEEPEAPAADAPAETAAEAPVVEEATEEAKEETEKAE